MRALPGNRSVHIKLSVEHLRPDLALQASDAPVRTGRDDDARPFKGDTLREILDEEFMRNHRFEGLTHLFTDLKGFLKNFVEREDVQVQGLERVEREA